MASVKTYASATAAKSTTITGWGMGTITPKAQLKVQPMYVSANRMTVGGHLGGSVESQNERLEQRIARQHNAKHRLTGPALAGEIFRTHWGEECVDVEDGYYDDKDAFEEGHLFQESLPLESPIETQERLGRKIEEYNNGYRSMCLAATRWHQLMEDVYEDEQVRKMFLDMQMIRKLSGLDHE